MPGPAGCGTHGHRLESAWLTVGYMIGKCSTDWACWKSARYSVVGVIVPGGPLGFACVFFAGAVTASLPVNPLPKTTATWARGPITLWIDAGIAAAVAPLPRMRARSPAIAWAPGR